MHTHCPDGPEERNRYLRLAPFSLVTSLVEYLAGYVSNSTVLQADALHTFSDLAENLLNAWVAEKARLTNWAERIRRFGFIGSFILIGGSSTWMGWEAWEKLTSSHPLPLPWWSFVIALFALCMNLCMWRIHESAPAHHRNVTHFAQHLHIMTDIGASVVAIGGVLLGTFTSWTTADAWGGFLIVLVIWVRLVRGAYALFVKKTSVLHPWKNYQE